MYIYIKKECEVYKYLLTHTRTHSHNPTFQLRIRNKTTLLITCTVNSFYVQILTGSEQAENIEAP